VSIFTGLTDRLGEVFRKWSGAGKLNSAQIDEGLREIRIALLEADVNLKVATSFLERVREKAQGVHIIHSLNPAEMLVKVVRDELVELLGGKELEPPDKLKSGLNVILMLGLQGSGKTTSAAKLALRFKRNGIKTMLAALDLSRPAAVDQLEVLGEQIGVPVFSDRVKSPIDGAADALEKAKREGFRALLMDTAGRLHIDAELVEEVRRIKELSSPSETYLVVDAMTGQEAVNVAETFDREVGITGLVVTKFDGDARAGAALSVKSVTGKPIRWVGTGEKVEMLEPFLPERMASRILGMGDVLSLIEKAEREIEEEDALRVSESFAKGKFDVSDFLAAMDQMKKLGPIKQVLGMLPGVNISDEMVDVGEERLKVTRAIALSMTAKERRAPGILDASRKRRIAAGSGTQPADVDQFLSQFAQMQQMMKMFAGGRGLANIFGGGAPAGPAAPIGKYLGGNGISQGYIAYKATGKSREQKAKAKAERQARMKQRKMQKKRK
jgi:signal recognition particle subunit SRP54